MKIVFMFCIVDKIHQEELWYRFFENATKYSKETTRFTEKCEFVVLINQKIPYKLTYLDEYKIESPIIAEWGTIEIVDIAANMINIGLEMHSDAERFFYLCESSIPIKPFSHIVKNLDKGKSYFSLFPGELNKTTTWYALNRKHAELCKNHYKEVPRHSHHPCECLFYTVLKDKFSLSDELDVTSCLRSGKTFCPWPGAPDNKDFPNTKLISTQPLGGWNRLTFEQIDSEDIDDLISIPSCFFVRKFTPETTVVCVKKFGEEEGGKDSIEYQTPLNYITSLKNVF